MREIVLIGAGGHCEACIDVIEKENSFLIRGILDAAPEKEGSVFEYPILGGDNLIPALAKECFFFISIGQILSSSIREKLFNQVKKHNGKFVTIVSPAAIVSRYAEIGEGTIIMHNAVVGAGAKIGNNCIINTLSNVEHGTVVGNHSHISTGAMINGGVMIGDNCFVGSGTVVNQNIKIASGAIIGSGSLVTKSITASGIYLGTPATLQVK